MEYTAHHQVYAAPAAHQTSSFSYFSNPNPNPNPTPNPSPIPVYANPVPPSDAAAAQYAAAYSYPPAPPAPAGVAVASYNYGPAGGDSVPQYAVVPITYQPMTSNTVPKTNSLVLEAKTQKLIQGGAAACSIRVCSICNVVCNGEKVFASHLTSEKHLMKALGRQPASKGGLKKGLSRVPNFIQSVYCEVCKLNCNSQDALNNHKFGKKHQRNLQKLQESMMPSSSNAVVGFVASAMKDASAANKGKAAIEQMKRKAKCASDEDLETKKRKVLEGGAAASAVRVCSLCNIVCNSQKVFEFHIAGQKHIAVVKKQQETNVT
ncbi:uncharacterized protein [Typha angustifolia]|uniref:uncharacterized protein n=1 Tax=Typha angustifolia TaxID=59011 RepID=UPI003C2ADFAD